MPCWEFEFLDKWIPAFEIWRKEVWHNKTHKLCSGSVSSPKQPCKSKPKGKTGEGFWLVPPWSGSLGCAKKAGCCEESEFGLKLPSFSILAPALISKWLNPSDYQFLQQCNRDNDIHLSELSWGFKTCSAPRFGMVYSGCGLQLVDRCGNPPCLPSPPRQETEPLWAPWRSWPLTRSNPKSKLWDPQLTYKLRDNSIDYKHFLDLKGTPLCFSFLILCFGLRKENCHKHSNTDDVGSRTEEEDNQCEAVAGTPVWLEKLVEPVEGL